MCVFIKLCVCVCVCVCAFIASKSSFKSTVGITFSRVYRKMFPLGFRLRGNSIEGILLTNDNSV